MLKVCKVAGPGVPTGMPFQFTDSSSGPSVPINAGLAPGNCKAKLLPSGTVKITELPVGGFAVSNIDVTPAANIVVPPNLPAGTVSVNIVNNEVTEVTYTNQSLKSPTGYIEICKIYPANAASAGGSFTFTIPSGIPGSVTVQAGYCSPPIEVSTATGSVTITETPVPLTQLVSCSVFPAGTCVHAAGTWTVTVPVHTGGLSTQTVVTITDGPVNGPKSR
jgi:hypothetical protein